jgi:Domain of unknown function (DUF6487)
VIGAAAKPAMRHSDGMAKQLPVACPSCSQQMESGVVEGTYLAWVEPSAARRLSGRIVRSITGGLAWRDHLGHGFWPRQAQASRCRACGLVVLASG